MQLPLKINYYYPIKRDWDLVFNYGTHLDLKTYQTINVEYVIDNEDVYQKLNTKNSKEIFHNMIFGTGLQYRRNKMIFQLIPSLTYNFREIDFQKSGKSFTINGGMFLKLR